MLFRHKWPSCRLLVAALSASRTHPAAARLAGAALGPLLANGPPKASRRPSHCVSKAYWLAAGASPAPAQRGSGWST
ncbi:hypothetical protein VZT92_013627 [Zoarces viviparus]|uniref:Secreted protein n=1 Tax=Zoarces viviparus TaxID=48416 RepID=A0AAW1F4D0_ZOAVI